MADTGARPIARVEVVKVDLTRAPEIAGFALDVPTPGTVEGGYNLTIAGWAVTPSGPPPAIQVALIGSDPLLDGPLTEVRLLIRRPDIGRRFPDISAADECGFFTSLSLVGLPPASRLAVLARLDDGRHILLAQISLVRDRLAPRSREGLSPVLLHVPGRAGSTWLTRLLGQHPRLVTYRPFQYEPRVAGYWTEVFRMLSEPKSHSRGIHPERTDQADWWVSDRAWLPLVDTRGDPILASWLATESTAEISAFCRGRIDAFYTVTGREQGKTDFRLFAERAINPWLTAVLRELYGGELSEVFLVRDPRDILVSRLSFMAKTGRQQFEREVATDDEDYARRQFSEELKDFLNLWKHTGNQATLLRYEELIRAPERTLTSLFEHLRIEADAVTVAQVIEVARRLTPERQETHKTARDDSASVGRWRRDLDETLLSACEDGLGDALIELGYRPSLQGGDVASQASPG